MASEGQEVAPPLTIASFEGTTQQKCWIFTEAKLAEMRRKANMDAAEAVVRTQPARLVAEAAVMGGDMVEPSPGKKARTEGGPIDTLTLEEDQALQDYYVRGVLKSSADLKLPASVESTAVTFYRRFFLSSSSMDYHPKDVMITSLWLACKVEHYPHRFHDTEKITIENKQFRFDTRSFASLGKLDLEVLLRIERVMLSTLHYHLMVFHPYRPLRGFIDACSEGPAGLSEEVREKLNKKASKYIRDMIRTDAAFVYAPAELALHALKHAAAEMAVNFAPLLEAIVPDAAARGAFVAVEEGVAGLVERLKRAQKEQGKSEMQRIDAKLQACRNPERDPKHPLYQRMEEDKKREKDQQREEKNRVLAAVRTQKYNELLGLGGQSDDATQ